MSNRIDELQRLIVRAAEAASDSHQVKSRRLAAWRRIDKYRAELGELLRQSTASVSASPSPELVAVFNAPYEKPPEYVNEHELAILEDNLARAVRATQHFQAFAHQARNAEDRARREELVAYWRARADNAQSRIDEHHLCAAKPVRMYSRTSHQLDLTGPSGP